MKINISHMKLSFSRSLRYFISLLVCCCLFAYMLPLAYGDGGSGINTGDFIYCGSFAGSPIKWKVLDGQAMNTGEPGAYLFSDIVLDKAGTAFDEYIVGWQGSLAQEWCGNFFDSAFSETEKIAIPAVSKTEEPCQYFGLRWGATELINENVFFISSLELTQYIGDHDGAEGISGYAADGEVAYYWLRTSHQNHTDYSGLVLQGNDVHDFLVYIVWGCRPAMNIDYSKVVNIVPAYEGAENQWKLTIADESKGFELSNVQFTGTTLSADYSIEDYTEGQFISVLVRDANGNIYSSERLTPAQTAAGTVEIDIGSISIPDGGRLFLFAEQDNGDYMTGCASKAQELACKVAFDAGEGSGSMEGDSVAPGAEYVIPDSTFTAPTYKVFDHWENEEGDIINDAFTVSRDTTLRAIYKNIEVSAISFDQATVELPLFEEASCMAMIEPDNAADKTVAWESSSEKTVGVSDNLNGSSTIKAKWPGTAVITAKSADGGANGSFSVTVTGSPVLAATAMYWPFATGAVALAALITALCVKKKKRK